MRWFVPSWNGDLRLESSEVRPEEETILSIVKPTPEEKRILSAIQEEAVRRGWLGEGAKAKGEGFLWRKKKVILGAPIAEVGPIVATLMRPGPAVLTAIVFQGGKMVTSSGGAAELSAALAPPIDLAAKREEKALAEEKKKEEAAEPKEEPKVAATVKRHTPSCPQCSPGAIEPAKEVLLSFLNDEEHASWAKNRTLVVEGGLSGHRYLLAHRHSATAQSMGRICYDIDNDAVVHFHDWTVPPEEEVLAAKLILQHREPWLRNEATLFHRSDVMRFKNPFGGMRDGVWDAMFTQRFGRDLQQAMTPPLKAKA